MIGQSTTTVLQQLKKEKTLRLEWVHQQYLPDSGSVAGNYPLYPDQMKEGEGEAFVGLKLELANCDEDSCMVNVWVEYVSSVQFPERKAKQNLLDLFEGGTPANASIYPKIEDTRYVYQKKQSISLALGNLDSIPVLVNLEKGILEQTWNEAIKGQESKLPTAFNYFHLQTFLKSLWQAAWLDKEHYQIVKKEKQFGRLFVYFFRPIHPPKTTIITGRTLSPTIDTLSINGLREGSLIRTFEPDDIVIDEQGRFKISTVIDRPKDVGLSYGFNTLMLYVEPGDSLFIEIDANAFYRKTTFSGDQAVANKFLLDFFHELRNDQVLKGLDEDLLQWSQLDYIKIFQDKEKKELEYLHDYEEQLHPSFFFHMDRYIRLDYADDLWYHAGWFYLKRDAQFHPKFLEYAQSLNKYLYRLPTEITYDFSIEQYVDFQKLVLKGRHTNQSMPFRSYDDFGLAKLILSPRNMFRLGRLLLFANKQKSNSEPYTELYEEIKEICKDAEELAFLEDYEHPELNLGKPRMMWSIAMEDPAPKWQFINQLKDTIRLTDFKSEYLLLHIGINQNLSQAIEDIEEIQGTTNTDFSVASIVSQSSSSDSIFMDRSYVHYIPYKEMQELRDSYNICLLYTSPSPRDATLSRMPSSA